jgi:hypothetical protein
MKMLATYLRSNLLSDLSESLANRIHGTLAFEDNRATRATAHINIGLGSPGDVTEDIPEGLLQLPAREHLGRSQAKLFHVFSRE